MKKFLISLTLAVLMAVPATAAVDSVAVVSDSAALLASDSAAVMADSAMAAVSAELTETEPDASEGGGLHKQLKRKFMEGSAGFMSLVALALVLGLAFCIERLVYLTLSEINARRLMQDIDARLEQGDVEGAKTLCRETRGPVASICYQGLLHIGIPRNGNRYGDGLRPYTDSRRHQPHHRG